MTSLTLLHGFTGSPRSWHAVRERIARRATTFREEQVASPALLGHSPESSESAVSTFVEEVDRLATIIAQRGARHHLCGYSLGGRLGLGLLARHAEMFTQATLVGAQPGLESEAERAERVRADERWCSLIEHDGVEAFVDEWERLPLFRSQERLPSTLRLAQREERLEHTARGLVQSLRVTGLGRMPSYWHALETMTVPVTLMVGELDRKFLQIAETMAARLPRARLVVVPDAGHNVVLERPDAVAAELCG